MPDDNSSLFPVELKLRIDWSELDYFGHVNNVSFFKYIQSSRVHYWDTIGLTEYHLKNKKGPLLASCQCNFKTPLYYPGHITIRAKTVSIGRTSFSLVHEIIDHTGTIAAEASDIMVMFDFKRNEKIPFPPELKKQIELLENKSF